MTTLEELKNIAKTEESEDKEENPFEKKAEDEKSEEKEVEKTEDEDETNKAILEALKSISDRLAKTEAKVDKAMETPTDLPQSPKGTADSEDVGDKVTAPKDPYPTGDQAGLHDDTTSEDKPSDDKGDLKMQEKSNVTHTTSPVERPAHSEVSKSNGKEDLVSYQVLQKCRSAGYQNLSEVGKSLLDIAEKYDKEGTL